MGGFVMGMLCSYLAFTDKGKALTNKLLDNLKQSVEVKEEIGRASCRERV